MRDKNCPIPATAPNLDVSNLPGYRSNTFVFRDYGDVAAVTDFASVANTEIFGLCDYTLTGDATVTPASVQVDLGLPGAE